MTNPDPGPDEIHYSVGVNPRQQQTSDAANDENPVPAPEIELG